MSVSTRWDLGAWLSPQSIVMAGMFAVWLISGINRGATNEQQTSDLRTEVEREVATLQTTLTNGLANVQAQVASVQQQIAVLPTEHATLDELQRRVLEDDAEMRGLDGRLTQEEHLLIQLQGEVGPRPSIRMPR
jgi:predicted nuclease with TOPRIM domain